MKPFLLSLMAAVSLAVSASFGVLALEGPHKVATGSYRFAGLSDKLVATDRKIDLWAQVYRPANLDRTAALIVFLHGNHGTCGRYDVTAGVRVDDSVDYTYDGTCPEGYVVTPNHLGYAYLAEELASWGYVVVSINANRGITAGPGVDGDDGLNLMRGRLILRHLALLSDWNRGAGDVAPPDTLGFNPAGKLDFSQVGLMGHSRGGEGVRAALQQFRDADSPFPKLIGPLEIRSLFEIGPVDGQTSRQLNANGVNSMILLPGCDGDVYDLQGMKVFDRVLTRGKSIDASDTFHGTFHVWGANHNAYNTEWLTSDSDGCRGSNQLFPANGRSLPQQQTALKSLVPFFRATVGAKLAKSLVDRFDPAVDLPEALTDITKYERGYLPRPIGAKVKVLESFSKPDGDPGVSTEAVGVKVVNQKASYEHDRSVRVATVRWTSSSPEGRYFQVNLASGVDLSSFKTLAFRTALRCFAKICETLPSNKGEMNYAVSLIGEKGKLSSAVRMNSVALLSRPAGPNFAEFTDTPDDYLHSTLYSVEIPLKAFKNVELSKAKAVRFTFENKPNGVVDLSGLTASTVKAPASGSRRDIVASASDMKFEPELKALAAPSAESDGNRLKIVRGGAAKADASAGQATVDIVLTSKRRFPITGAFPTLFVGKEAVKGGYVGRDGKTLTITVPASRYDALDKGGDVTLLLQTSSAPWKFGALPN